MIARWKRIYRIRQRRRRHREEWLMAGLRWTWLVGMQNQQEIARMRAEWSRFDASVADWIRACRHAVCGGSDPDGTLGNRSTRAEASRPRE